MPMPFLALARMHSLFSMIEQFLDFAHDALRIGRRQVDLIDDRNDRQIVLQRQVVVGQRLSFDALRRIDDQQRSLAGRQRARDFVREVDVARSVDQVELIGLAVARRVVEGDGVHSNRDPALALEIHGVERLLLEIAHLDRPRDLQQAIRERRLPMIDMRDNAKVANVVRNFEAMRMLGLTATRRPRYGKHALTAAAAEQRPNEHLQHQDQRRGTRGRGRQSAG